MAIFFRKNHIASNSCRRVMYCSNHGFPVLALVDARWATHELWEIRYLKAGAFDLQQRGGFVVQEEIMKATLEKLQLEIESLQTSFPEKAERFTTILASIATVAALFSKS